MYHKTGLRDVFFLEQALAVNGQSYFLTREPYRTRILRALHWLTGILMPDGYRWRRADLCEGNQAPWSWDMQNKCPL